MPRSYLKSLRKNRDGKLVMPYHIMWDDHLWKVQASELTICDTLESQIYELGRVIGTKCANLWRNVDAIVSQYPGPYIVRLMVDAANAIWVGIKRREEENRHLSFKDRYCAVKSEVTGDPELLTDLISEFLFSMVKKNVRISTTLVLPNFQRPYYPEWSDIAALIAYIQEIGHYKFLFDKCLFLEGDIKFDGNKLSISSAASDRGSIYLRANKLSQLRDEMAQPAQKVDKVRHREYKVVASAQIRSGRLTVDLISVYDSPHELSIANLRGYVASEYLFRVLESAKESIDAIYCWDIIYSLCEALRKANIKDATANRNDIVDMISVALNITQRRARKALEILTFRPGIRTRDGIWSRPVVPIDRNHITFVYAAVASVSPVRQIHHVIENINLSHTRGKEFEYSCVQNIKSTIGRLYETVPGLNEELYVLPESSKVFDLIGRKKRETDCIIVFGHRVLVCEAKSIAHVTTSREFSHAFEPVNHGLDQISKRILALNDKAKDLKSILKLDDDIQLNISGLLILNEGFFDGFSVNSTFCISLRVFISILRGFGSDKDKMTLDIEYPIRSEGIYQTIMHMLNRLAEENRSDKHVVIKEGFMETKDGSFSATFDYPEFAFVAD